MRVSPSTILSFLKIAGLKAEDSALFNYYRGQLHLESPDGVVQVTLSDDPCAHTTTASVPAGDLKKAVQAYKDVDSLEIFWTTDQVTLRSGAALTPLATSEVSPVSRYTQRASVATMSLAGASLACASPLMDLLDPGSTRSYGSALRIEATPEKRLRLVATNGYALSTYTMASDDYMLGDLSLPYLAAKRLFALAKLGDPLTVGVTDLNGHLVVSSPTTRLTLPIMDAQYPRYQNVIPNNLAYARPFDRKAFASQVKRLLPSTTKKDPSIKISNHGDRTMLQTPSGALAWLPFSLGDFDLPLYLNGNYLAQALGASGDHVGGFRNVPGDPDAPITLEIGNYSHIIVPIKAPAGEQSDPATTP